MSVAVEMTFEGVSGVVTYHTPRLVVYHIEVIHHAEIGVLEIEAVVHKHGKAVELGLVADQVGVHFCAGAAAESRGCYYKHNVFFHTAVGGSEGGDAGGTHCGGSA